MIISCNVGYALSVTMAVILPIGTWLEASWRSYCTKRRTNWCETAGDILAWFFLILVGQGLPVTGIALILGRNTHPSEDGVFGGFIVAILFLSVCLFFCGILPLGAHVLDQYPPMRTHILRMITTVCLIVPGFVLLAIYYNKCIEPLDYHGPMYIIDIRTETVEDAKGYDDDLGIVSEYNGQVQVGFGSTWACEKDIAGVWCEPWVRVKDCEFCSKDILVEGKTICSAGSRQDAATCIRQTAYPDFTVWEDTIPGWPQPSDDSLWYKQEERPDKETTY